MEMSRGMIGKIHQDYYPIEETNFVAYNLF